MGKTQGEMTNALLVIIAVLLFFILGMLTIIADEIVRSRHQDELQTSSQDDFSRQKKIGNNIFVMLFIIIFGVVGYMLFA